MTDTKPIRVGSLAIPSEHGGWSLTLEPVILGLIVAPSGAGLALGVAALAAFLTRTPLKLALVDRWRGRRLDRTRLAEWIALGYSLVVLLAVVIATVVTEGPFWPPFVLAFPLVAIGLWFDMRSRSRRLLPELSATVGIGSVSAAIVLAGGGTSAGAIGAWSVVTLRAVATIPFVRCQLSRAKGQGGTRQSDVAQAVVAVCAAVGWLLDIVPPLAGAVVIVLAVIQTVLSRMSPPRAAVIGAQQVVLGLTVVLASGLALAAP